MAIG
ncbi:UNVERIFIED_CONTAM: hypothetical protein GTU68_026216 [Idotea baltica]|jgi:hypothetical protein